MLSFKTPLVKFNDEVKNVYLKLENLQPFGSYKVRGIESLLNQINPSEYKLGLTAASIGNMGQAVAFMARELKIPCEIIVPDTAPDIKIKKIESLGAVVIRKPLYQVWEYVKGKRFVNNGMYFIHPSQNQFLIEGYSQIADEIILDNPFVEAVIIPFGVGGLFRGVSKRLKKLKPKVKVYSVEPIGAKPFYNYFHDINIIQERVPSFIDAIGTPDLIEDIKKELKSYCDGALFVDDEVVKKSIKQIFFEHHTVVEGAGAAAVASYRELDEDNIVCLVSGGNIDTQLFLKIINDT
ncbi:MAG: threonine dehydratase [Bacteriovoracaceae bacterium]|jgi:threonine dehydratase